MQHITYTEWLPKILGPAGMEKLGRYQGYKSDVDASVSNTFTTAALRFGHTLIRPIISRFNEDMQPIPEGNIPLSQAFFVPSKVITEGGIDPLLRGLFGSPAQQQKGLNSELTERLFQISLAVALDLAALNIQRGSFGFSFLKKVEQACAGKYLYDENDDEKRLHFDNRIPGVP